MAAHQAPIPGILQAITFHKFITFCKEELPFVLKIQALILPTRGWLEKSRSLLFTPFDGIVSRSILLAFLCLCQLKSPIFSFWSPCVVFSCPFLNPLSPSGPQRCSERTMHSTPDSAASWFYIRVEWFLFCFQKSLGDGTWPDTMGVFSCGSILSHCILGTIENYSSLFLFLWFITDCSQLSFNEDLGLLFSPM